jgi:flagellar protein FlgJ
VLIGLLATAQGASATGNAAVTVAALVAEGSTLNVRSGPSTSYPVIRKVDNDAPLSVVCQVEGQSIPGTVRTSSRWDRLVEGRYIADAFVIWPDGNPAVPLCSVGQAVVADTFSAIARVDGAVYLRANASTVLSPVGTVQTDQSLAVVCQLGGESVLGTVRSSETWDRLADGTFISDGYVDWGPLRPPVPWCTLTADLVPAAGEQFIAWAAGYAQQSQATYRVPAAVTIAQAILESGWGRSALAEEGNNLFGMKCFGSPGSVASGCRPYSTSECASSACYATNATFRVYTAAAMSFRDHSNSFAVLPRYRTALAFVDSPDDFARAIHQAGYATSPSYAQDLIDMMHKYNLYRFGALS